MNAIDFSFDPNNRYNFWSGLIGGFFLALAYFGTDQSQVGRYLTGHSVDAEPARAPLQRHGQGADAVRHPVRRRDGVRRSTCSRRRRCSSIPWKRERVEASSHAARVPALCRPQHDALTEAKRARDRGAARGTPGRRRGRREAAAATSIERSQRPGRRRTQRGHATDRARRSTRRSDATTRTTSSSSFVLASPAGRRHRALLAVIFAASMISTAARAQRARLDDDRRRLQAVPAARAVGPRTWCVVSKRRDRGLGRARDRLRGVRQPARSLIEAVNILGSLFYGTILGIFLVAFYVQARRRHGGVRRGAGRARRRSSVCFASTDISFLWYNVVGCLGTIACALVFSLPGGRWGRPVTQSVTS